MASSFVLRRVTVPTLFARLVNPIRSASVAPSLSRSFNTNAQVSGFDEDDRAVDVNRRSDRSVSYGRGPGFFSGSLFSLFSCSFSFTY
jgi:HSP20 family protein